MTLIELMVAAVCLGFIAAPVLGCVSMVRQNIAEARTQTAVLALLRNDLNTASTLGLLTLLLAGNATSTSTIQGGTTVTIQRTYVAVSGYTNLYRFTSTATWTSAASNYRNDTLTLEFYNYVSG